MMTVETVTQIMRQGYTHKSLNLVERVKAQGYQVTVLQNCDSIYIADPSGVGCIFDTRTGTEILKKLDIFFRRIHS